MQKSTGALRKAYPLASVRTFVAPENKANKDTMAAMKANGLEIFSNEGTMACPNIGAPRDQRNSGICHQSWCAGPPRYNYQFVPCQDDRGPPACPGSGCCIPPGDVYATAAGFQKLAGANRIFSTPTGSANSEFNFVTQGLSVNETLGAGACGPNAATIVASAKTNAAKSSGLLWTVLMMHPQTCFDCHKDHAEWLEELLWQSRASLPEHELRFIHFQDLVELSPPDSDCTRCLATEAHESGKRCVVECAVCKSVACEQCIATDGNFGSDCFFDCC
eukprot:SAG11_NODE_2477_length_3313_cov_2.275980_4_plen_276_part_00